MKCCSSTGSISLISRFGDVMLLSLYIPSHFLPGPLDSHLTSIQVVSHPDAGPHIYVSPLSMWSLSYIQFPKIASQLYPGTISKLPRMLYVLFTSIPALYQLHPDHKILVSTPSMYCLTSGNIHVLTSHLHVAYRLHPDADIRISSPSK